MNMLTLCYLLFLFFFVVLLYACQVLPLLQAIFQENLLQRRNLDSYIHMQIVQLIMAACQNNGVLWLCFSRFVEVRDERTNSICTSIY